MSLEHTATNFVDGGSVEQSTNDDEPICLDRSEDVDINEESRGLLVDNDDASADEGALHVFVEMDYSYPIKLLMAVAFLFAIGVLAGRNIPPKRTPTSIFIPTTPTSEINHAGNNWMKQRQIANYINGTALLVSVHVTHHAGTAICSEMKKLGPTPEFACMGPGRKDDDDKTWPPGVDDQEAKKSWSYSDTALYVEKFRKLFHFISQEYKNFAKLQDTNWEYENLVSMIVMRDPIERFLAKGRCGEAHGKLIGDPTSDNAEIFWQYANSDCVDNYALRVLADHPHCAHGAKTTLECLDSAKALLKRFTFILDQNCLDESMIALGKKLHLNITVNDFKKLKKLHHRHPKFVRERINNDTLYDFLSYRFRRDIELYEWSKTRSIVKCD